MEMLDFETQHFLRSASAPKGDAAELQEPLALDEAAEPLELGFADVNFCNRAVLLTHPRNASVIAARSSVATFAALGCCIN